MVSRNQAAHFVQSFSVGKKRRSVSIRTHPQRNQVKTWQLCAFEPETVSQLRLISSRSHSRLQFALHTVNLLGPQRRALKQRLTGHAVVALFVVGGNAALVN